MIVYKLSDRIPVKIGNYTVWISPLSAGHYAQVMGLTKLRGGAEIADGGGMAILTLRSVVKKIEGFEDVKFADGGQFELEFDPDGLLSEESLSVLMSILGSDKFSVLATKLLLSGIDDHKIPGVTIDLKNVVTSKKKKTS